MAAQSCSTQSHGPGPRPELAADTASHLLSYQLQVLGEDNSGIPDHHPSVALELLIQLYSLGVPLP